MRWRIITNVERKLFIRLATGHNDEIVHKNSLKNTYNNVRVV